MFFFGNGLAETRLFRLALRLEAELEATSIQLTQTTPKTGGTTSLSSEFALVPVIEFSGFMAVSVGYGGIPTIPASPGGGRRLRLRQRRQRGALRGVRDAGRVEV